MTSGIQRAADGGVVVFRLSGRIEGERLAAQRRRPGSPEVLPESGQGLRLHVRTPQGERLIEGSDLLAATGRTPNTAGIGLDAAGVRLDGRGYVRVNDRLETSAPDVWAIGECAGSPPFDFSVFSASAGASLLAAYGQYPLSIDALKRPRESLAE